MIGHKYMRSISVNKGTFCGHRFIDEFMDDNKANFACEKLHLPPSRKGSFYGLICVLKKITKFKFALTFILMEASASWTVHFTRVVINYPLRVVWMVTKTNPTYNLASIQESLDNINNLRMTYSARADAYSLGLTDQDIISAIQGIKPGDFYKSMASNKHPKASYFDVYKFKYKNLEIYTKFQLVNGFIVVSFKEK